MKNSWLVWLFVVALVITVLVAFNYQGRKSVVPLSEIFPEEETFPVDVEYQFEDQAQQRSEAVEKVELAAPLGNEKSVAPLAKAPETVAVKSDVPVQVQKDLAPTKTATTPFTIQVASYQSREAAEKSFAKVLEKGYQGFIISKNLGEKGTWHRVYIGNFQNKPQAQGELTKVQQDYPNSFIIAPK